MLPQSVIHDAQTRLLREHLTQNAAPNSAVIVETPIATANHDYATIQKSESTSLPEPPANVEVSPAETFSEPVGEKEKIISPEAIAKSDPSVPIENSAVSAPSLENYEIPVQEFVTVDENVTGEFTEIPLEPVRTQPIAAIEHDGWTIPQTEAAIPVTELPAPTEEVEVAMAQLLDALDTVDETENDEPTRADAILEKILALPAELANASEQEVVVLAEKLEELFIELFEEVGINYTPELIESFVKLTETHYLEAVLQTSENIETETADQPNEIGTREFLQKLQDGLRAMKQAMINFYEIGKSILRVYNYDLQAIQAVA